MTTTTWSTAIANNSDAGFRAWGSEFAAKMAVVGLVQTADTGQINWATVTRPVASYTAGGYEIWRFVDSTIFMKIEYGSGNGATPAGMWITVGTGSNGAGALTGQLSTRATFTSDVNETSTVTAYASYMSRTADSFSVAWKVNAYSSSYPLAFLVVGKSVDGAGAASTLGFGVLKAGYASSRGPHFQSVRTLAAAATYNDSAAYSVVPGLPTNSAVGVDFQAYQIFMNLPQVVPFAFANVYLTSEITKLNTFSVAMVGAAARTFLALGQIELNVGPSGLAVGLYTHGMIWE